MAIWGESPSMRGVNSGPRHGRVKTLPADLAVVLLVRDVLEPVDVVAVEMLLQGDVHHVGVGSGAVPVLFGGRDPDRVAGPDLADGFPPQLDPAHAGDDVQGL